MSGSACYFFFSFPFTSILIPSMLSRKRNGRPLNYCSSLYLAGAVSIYNAQIGTPPKLQGFIVGLAATIIIWSMQGIMQLRISAMYGHSWKIIMLLLFFFICEVVSMSTTAGILFSETYVKQEDITNSGTVKAVIYSPILYGCWIATVIMEALILVLALYAGYLHTATTRQMGNARTPFLAFTVIRDSILFPFLAFISYTITTIGWKYFPGPYAFGDVVSSFSSLVACVSGPRIILNLREAFYLPFTNEYDQAVRENSVLDPMEFADGDTEDSADGSSISNDQVP
ncbi:hypothetical protein BDQ17DRAFT_1538390 [Cyathus striatus]|nr:hypothetical protein BDQ17DRAFT_1538390 [Cyathus striatus]